MTRAVLATLAALFLLAAGPDPAPGQSADGGPPKLSAPAAYAVEASTGEVVAARDEDERRPIASATKLMTALVVREESALDDTFTAADYQAAPVESQIGLQPGEEMTVRDLLRALMLESANDAAVTLAEGVAGSEDAFVKRMNARAAELGMEDTTFANAVGLDDPDNLSTARDLVTLALAVRDDAFLRETAGMEQATLESGERTRVVTTRNELVRETELVGGLKTGRTQAAGYVLVGSGTRDGVTIVSAVLGAPSEAARQEDTLALLRYGLGLFDRVTAVREADVVARVPLAYREDTAIALAADDTVRQTVREGEELRREVTGVPEEVDGPLERGAQLGTLVVRRGDEVVARVPLVTTRAVEEAGVALRVEDLLMRPTTILLLLILAVCSVPMVALRRRALRRQRQRA
ncbi:MAG TPA: D-alanyl-D-alanine carboxypeptidase family protein [Solirubrobacteraceae bacterium]|nr:D-alanyl-D-alanine carboxypeptidase family protein [Solirubrobacteraceae bacterium]